MPLSDEDIERCAKHFPNGDLDHPIGCAVCHWHGRLRDANVVYRISDRPRQFRCPNNDCNSVLIDTTPHTW